MLGRTDSRRRMLLLLITFVVIAASLVARLAYWQVTQRDRLAQEAFAQTTARTETPSRRGDIYDRSGVVVLATTVDRERLAAMPSFIAPQRRQQVAAELVRILRLEGDAADQLTERMIDRQEVHRPRSRGRSCRRPTGSGPRRRTARSRRSRSSPQPVRVYPHEGGGPDSTLAAQLLGFVNRDYGEGQYGVEQYYQDQLAGRPRIVHAQRDVSGRPIPDTAVIEDPGTAGEDIRLTIDAGLQLAVEQEFSRPGPPIRRRACRPSSSTRTPARCCAEATYPSYDANQYQAVAAADPNALHRSGRQLRLRAGLGLQDADRRSPASRPGRSRPRRRSRTSATLKLDGGRTHVDDADRKGRGWMTFEDAHRLLAQRRRREGRAAARRGHAHESSAILHDDVDEDGLRGEDRDRRRGRGQRGSSTTRRSRPGSRSTSRTARSARASR